MNPNQTLLKTPALKKQRSKHQEKLKILVITSSYPFSKQDYHALFVHQMNLALQSDSRFEVEVLTPMVPNAKEKEEMDGIQIHRFQYRGFSDKKRNLTGDDGIVENLRRNKTLVPQIPGFLWAFQKAARKKSKDFDLIISHWLIPSALIGLGCSLPQLILSHGSDAHLFQKLPFAKLLMQRLLKKGHLYTTSKHIESLLAPFFPERAIRSKSSSFQLGIQFENNSLTSRSLYTGKSPFRLVFMGRILRAKGMANLLDLMKILQHCTLTIAGDGEDLEWMKQQSQGLPIHFAGIVRGKQKAELLSQSHLFVFLPEKDHRENLPVSIMEALAYGLPVLSCRVGGVGEVVQNQKNGLLLNSYELDSAQQAVIYLQNQPDVWLEFSKQAADSAKSFRWDFRLKQLTKDLLQLFNET